MTLIDPIGAISIYGALDEGLPLDAEDFTEIEPMLIYGHSVPSGVTYNYDKTRLTIGRSAGLDEEEERVIDVSEWSNNLRHVDASDYDYAEITLLGDYKANELYAGHAGSYMDGGMGMDKLYGGEGADTFAYAIGEGSDYIYNYDSTHEDAADKVLLLGAVGMISRESFSESGDNTILRVGSQKLTFVNPAGRITVVDEEDNTLATYSSTLEGGVYYNVGKTILTIGRNAALADNVIDMATLSNNLRNINGSGYTGELYLIGNRRPNELYAGAGGSTLDGRGGNDKLYGGTGADVFVISVGGGNDVIYNYDGRDEESGGDGDVLMLVGGGNISRSNFQDSGGNTFLTLGNNKVMLDNPIGAIRIVNEDGAEILRYGQDLPSGVAYASNKTKLVIGRDAELGESIDVSEYVNNLRDVDASEYEGNDLVLVGDGKANEFRAGSGGSSMNGGLGNDKLYGGDGADIFCYTVGEGNDKIYNFNARQGDYVQLFGVSDLDRSNFRETAGNVVLRLGMNTLTFVNPIGPITFTDSEGNEFETTYEDELPAGVSYNANKTKLTVGREADLEEDNVLDMATLSNNIRDIDATYYEGELVLVGNAKVNELRAGSGGSSMDGGAGNDKYYGGAGADTYVVSIGSGNDMIYNYNGDQEDVIEVFGVDTLSGSNFQDSSQNVFLNIGSQRILINNPTGTITVRYGEDDEQVITYGGTMPRGVSYSADKRTLTIGRGAEVEDGAEFDMATLSNSLLNIDATYFEGNVNLKGNGGVNELHAGSGGSSMDGGAGSDKLYGGDGADTFVWRMGEGSDHIYNYDGEDGDVLQLIGIAALSDNAIRESGQNLSIQLGNDRLTLVRPTGQVTIVDENGDELTTYNNSLPDGVSYNQSRTKLTVTNAADLGDDNLLDMATLSNNLRDIDASTYDGEIYLRGNNRQNELRAGLGGSSLNGGRGNDKLYGGAGADTYAYTVGEGNDYIYNYSGGDGDVIQVSGNVNIDESSFKDNGTNVVLTVGSNRLTVVDSQGQIVVVDEDGSTIATHNEALPEGVHYNRAKTKLIIEAGAELEEVEVRVDDYKETLRDIDATAYNEEIELIGDEQANELYAGSGGSTLEGGAGNDNLYGGAGVDMFRYTEGDGNDMIYNYDSTSEDAADVVQLLGVSGVEMSDFRDSGKNTILTVGTQRITFVNPKGQIIVVDENDEEIARYGSVLPEGMTYNNAKTKLTIGRNAELESEVIDMTMLSSNLKEVDATSYEGELTILGNGKSNVLRAGSGGSSLNGGLGNDKLYGGAGSDVYAYTVDEGNDKIYNYGTGDMIVLEGVSTIDRTNFKESGKNVVLTVGSNRLTVVNSPGLALTVQVEGEEEPFVYGSDLSEGMSYNSTKTKLTVGSTAELGEDNELRVEDYVNNLKDINASGYGEEIALIGDDKANELRAGSGGSTLSGGGGNDKLYGGRGADVFVYTSGGDEIYNYDPEEDSVSLDGGRVTAARINGNDIVYSVGTGSLTLKNVAVYGLMAIRFAGETSEELAAESYWFEGEVEEDSLAEIVKSDAALTDESVFEGADELRAMEMKVTANVVGRKK